MSKLEDISIFLSRLDLKPDKVPTYAEYKKKYREKMHLHPDKAGSVTEEVFKEITEAAKKIHDFITENPDLQRTNTDEFKRVAKCFNRENNVEYNKNNIVIHFEMENCSAWMEALSKRFGASIPLEDQVGVQFKTPHLQIPKLAENFGSFSASVWSNPKKGTPKILIQGKSYMAFVTFVLPEILKEIELKNDKLAIESPVTDGACAAAKVTDLETLMIGFQKMESEVIKLRDNLVGIVDESLQQIKDDKKMEKIEKKIGKLEEIALGNQKVLTDLNTKIDNIVAHQQRIKPVDVDALEEFISSSKTTFTKLENITTIHTDAGVVAAVLEKNEQAQEKAIKEVLSDSKNVVAKLDVVSKATVDIKDKFVSNSDDMKTIIEKGNKIMPVLDKISRHVSSLVEHMESPKAQEEPSVRAKEQQKNDADNEEPEVQILEPKKRKGLFFSSSIALQCDIQQLSNDINSKIGINKTYHIEKHEEAKDPDLFLEKTLGALDDTNGIDFIIISVGSNDITKLNIEEDLKGLNEKACEQSKLLVHLAQEASEKHNVDVFVVEKPARFDREVKDPEGIRATLTVSSNGILPSLITPLKRVHFIPLPSLSSKADRDCFSRDGIHLTTKGEHLFLIDLVAGVKDVFSDLKLEQFKHPDSKNRNRNFRSEYRNTSDDNQNGFGRKYNGRNNRSNSWKDQRNNQREYRNTGRNHRYYQNYRSHTPRQEQQYYRYSESQYRVPDNRHHYRGHTQEQYRNTEYNQYRHREQEQTYRGPYTNRDYQHRYVQDDYQRY